MFLEETWLTQAQLAHLETLLDSGAVKAQLREIFVPLAPSPAPAPAPSATPAPSAAHESILTDFHFYNYAFCKERAFSSRQTCSFMSIMQHIFRSDAESPASTAESSHAALEALLLKHAVERPPMSIRVFSGEDQVAAILEHAANSYYRHFLLYKYVFGRRLLQRVEQQLPHEVEYATPKLQPLDAGLFRE